MSCGNPHEVDCSEVIEQVYLYLDGEIDDEGRQKVREHLDECAPCLRQFGLEQDVKALFTSPPRSKWASPSRSRWCTTSRTSRAPFACCPRRSANEFRRSSSRRAQRPTACRTPRS